MTWPGSKLTVAVVIPCFRVEDHVEAVVRSVPEWVDHVIAVDDSSPDRTGAILDRLAGEITRLEVVHHPVNRGVGTTMVSGYRQALRLGADLVVKLDGDGQMDPGELPGLLIPLFDGRADYAKGNRFRHPSELRRMPAQRLLGNVLLTFLTKLATGYWHVFDVQNGYTAITREALADIPLDRLEPRYFFENSMLALLNIQGRPVIDVPMPAIYRGERSNMNVVEVALTFPIKLLHILGHRITLKYLIYDVSPVAVYLGLGLALLAFSLVFGGYHWWLSWSSGVPASTGTVVLALLPFLMAFNLVLEAVHLDIEASPRPRPPGPARP